MFYFEVCAFCKEDGKPDRILGCIRFNFDNQKRKVIPTGDFKLVGEGEEAGIEMPAYGEPSELFRNALKDWNSKAGK